MNKVYLMLADVEVSDLLDIQKHSPDSRLYEVLVTFGAISLAVVVAVIWAVFYSLKKKKRKHHAHRRHRSESASGASPRTSAASEHPPAETDSRQRIRRRSHRPLNPTLAQTRGLPPMRDENTPLPPMP
jgi:hypothetical protein